MGRDKAAAASEKRAEIALHANLQITAFALGAGGRPSVAAYAPIRLVTQRHTTSAFKLCWHAPCGTLMPSQSCLLFSLRPVALASSPSEAQSLMSAAVEIVSTLQEKTLAQGFAAQRRQGNRAPSHLEREARGGLRSSPFLRHPSQVKS